MKKLVIPAMIALCSAVFSNAILGQGVPAPYTPRLQTVFTGLTRPVMIRGANDSTNRRFILQQNGIIRVVLPGTSTPTDFMNIAAKITVPVTTGDERGLLGLAFHPQFASNGKFYVNYTRVNDGTTVVAEYKTLPGNPNQGDVASERILFSVPQPFTNHNGGNLNFGADGYLYIGMGDGGSSNDPGNRAQNPAQLLGKMLRIDVNIPAGSPVPYLIPPTNPFVGAGTVRCDNGSTTNGNTCQEIWTVGMRNPWRWSFDRGTNTMWVADVGQNAVEEVDIISSGGGNYGWRVFEGTSCTGVDPTLCNSPGNYIMPAFQYTHASGRCSITGGYVYRGTQGSLPNGAYVYADYCSGEIWYRMNDQTILLQDTPRSVVSFGEDDNGEIYVCYSNGQIDKIVRAKASADFDGDLKTDISVFRPSNGFWYIANSSNNTYRFQNFGLNGDVPVPADYDGDNITDIGVFRPSTGGWYYVRSSDNTFTGLGNGGSGNIPIAGDLNGDSKADFAAFDPSNGFWSIVYSGTPGSTQVVRFGLAGDIPTVGDYDGDGKADIAIFRPSGGVWAYWPSSTLPAANYSAVQWGQAGDIPVPGDYDGDLKTDFAVFRPSTGTWYIVPSSNGSTQFIQWGANGDVPAAGDYDGDGKSDVAVFRPSGGDWYILRSSNGGISAAHFGSPGDLAAPAFDTP
ncbi:MAG: PQQ-dependent sugar dehydrogenase [Acidobacteriota bacterium]